MRTLILALAAVTPAQDQQFEPKQIGRYELSSPVCKHGILGVRIKAPASSEPLEANVYFNLRAICRGGDDDAEPQSTQPLPEGASRV